MVQAIVAGMKDPVPRVLAHAVTCVISFSEEEEEEEADPSIIAKYASSFLLGLKDVFGCPHLRVQETAVCALSALAASMKSLFAPYHSTFVPLLKGIVRTAGQNPQKDVRQLRGRALEALSIIGLAVGKEAFGGDALEVLQEIKAYTPTDPDDPQVAFIEMTLGRFSEILGADFAPFLPFAVPKALERASLKEEINVLSCKKKNIQKANVVNFDIYFLLLVSIQQTSNFTYIIRFT